MCPRKMIILLVDDSLTLVFGRAAAVPVSHFPYQQASLLPRQVILRCSWCELESHSNQNLQQMITWFIEFIITWSS